MIPAFPKPGQIKRQPRPFKTLPDGREICTKCSVGYAEYRLRIKQMWTRDGGRCCLCGKPVPLEEATFEHKQGRGAGKRDDRIDGNGVAHCVCNSLKGSMSFDVWKLTHPEAF